MRGLGDWAPCCPWFLVLPHSCLGVPLLHCPWPMPTAALLLLHLLDICLTAEMGKRWERHLSEGVRWSGHLGRGKMSLDVHSRCVCGHGSASIPCEVGAPVGTVWSVL